MNSDSPVTPGYLFVSDEKLSVQLQFLEFFEMNLSVTFLRAK